MALGARAVAVLAVLVSRANEYVQKSAILDAAWPGLVVEEANLAVQISAIRRALARVPAAAAGSKRWRGAATALSGRLRKLPAGRCARRPPTGNARICPSC